MSREHFELIMYWQDSEALAMTPSLFHHCDFSEARKDASMVLPPLLQRLAALMDWVNDDITTRCECLWSSSSQNTLDLVQHALDLSSSREEISPLALQL